MGRLAVAGMPVESTGSSAHPGFITDILLGPILPLLAIEGDLAGAAMGDLRRVRCVNSNKGLHRMRLVMPYLFWGIIFYSSQKNTKLQVQTPSLYPIRIQVCNRNEKRRSPTWQKNP